MNSSADRDTAEREEPKIRRDEDEYLEIPVPLSSTGISK
jgi:hypothetical protein